MDIPGMSDNDLARLYTNCVNSIVGNKANRGQAEAYIEEINAVWRQRLADATEGLYKAESPETGVMKVMGYSAGKDAPPTPIRHALLDLVMTGQLPFVGSPAHMLEWGEPRSLTRYRKLHRFLASQRTRASSQEKLERAFRLWDEDMDYIEGKWRNASG